MIIGIITNIIGRVVLAFYPGFPKGSELFLR